MAGGREAWRKSRLMEGVKEDMKRGKQLAGVSLQNVQAQKLALLSNGECLLRALSSHTNIERFAKCMRHL